MHPARWIAAVLVSAAIAAGVVFWVTNLKRPDDGREPQVADEAAGGRTQAVPFDSAHAGLAGQVSEIDDPLAPGIPEAPDLPANEAHRGLRTIGERIRDVVLADGVVGDDEVPGVTFAASLGQPQRRWFVETAPSVRCGCGCEQDLLECRRDDVSCPESPGIRDSLLAVARQRN